MMQSCGIATAGIDPTQAMIEQARRRDPHGAYQIARAEALPFADRSFDLVVSYLTLIDISDIVAACAEMMRVLRLGGTLLIANLTSFATAGVGGWTKDADGAERFCIDHYLDERAEWVEWRGIRIVNWHRPLTSYMAPLIAQGLILRHFSEPTPQGGDPAEAAKYRRVPYLYLMEWQKP
jgi:SAM-dependent methyltransferase